MTGLVVIACCLGFSLMLNGLLFWLYSRSQAAWMQMFRQQQGLELPQEIALAQDAEVVRTAKDLVANHQQRRRRQPAFSIPVPGTEWMKKAKEQ